jgi:type II secretory pathway pseudopilin PulG
VSGPRRWLSVWALLGSGIMSAMPRAVVIGIAVVAVALVACQREQQGISEDLPAARATRAQADAQAIAAAIRQYQATFGTLPDSIEDLTGARTTDGVSGGPFLAKVPTPPTGWSAYQYARQGDSNFTVTSSGAGATVTAP